MTTMNIFGDLSEFEDKKSEPDFTRRRQAKERKSQSRAKVRKVEGTRPHGYFQVNPPPPKADIAQLAANTIEIEPHHVDELKAEIAKLTDTYQTFIRKTVLPHLIALDTAIEYSHVLLVDGMGMQDVTSDDTTMSVMRWTMQQKCVTFISQQLGIEVSEDVLKVMADMLRADLIKSNFKTEPDLYGILKKQSSQGSGVIGVKESIRRG